MANALVDQTKALGTATMPRSLLMVASSFPPITDAGVYRTLRFVRYLPALGWNVHVLTMNPRWHEKRIGMDNGLLNKVPGSVEVHRTAVVYVLEWLNKVRRPLGRRELNNGNGQSTRNFAGPNSNASALQRLKDALSVPLMTPDCHVGWIPFAVRAGQRAVGNSGIDAIYSTGPPWTNQLVGYRLKRSTGRPWVADFRDPWVGSDFKPFRRGNTWAGRRHQQLERRVVEAADRIIVNTPRSYHDMLGRYGDELADKLTVIPNGFDPADYEWANVPPPPKRPGKLIIAHAGSFYGKRNVNGLIEAIGNLCRAGAIPRGALEVRLIGALRPGRSEEQERVKAAGLEEVIRLAPRMPHDECLRQLAEADVLLLVQVGAPLSVPGKAYEYIALGKPILTVAHSGATTDLMEREKLGTWVSPDDVAGIEEAIKRLHRQLTTKNGLPGVPATARDRYDGRKLTQQLEGILRDLIVD